MPRILLAPPSVSTSTTCLATCVLLYEIFSTPVYFVMYHLAQVYRPTILLCGILSALSMLSGLCGVCRTTPALVISLMVATSTCFAGLILGGLGVIFALDVEAAVASHVADRIEPLADKDQQELVEYTNLFLIAIATLQLTSAVFHGLLGYQIYNTLGEKRGSAAFLQVFSITLLPFSLFLVIGSQYVFDTGTQASAPYTGISIFVAGTLLLAIAVLGFIGANFEYRRLLSICSTLSFLFGTVFLGGSIAYFVMHNNIEKHIVDQWDKIRIILPPTFKSKYDQEQFIRLIRTNLKAIAYVGIIAGIFLLQEASICLILRHHTSATKRQAANDKHAMKEMQAEASRTCNSSVVGSSLTVVSSGNDPAFIKRFQWISMFELSTRRQRLAMRLAAVVFILGLGLIFGVMCANIVFATNCSRMDHVVASSNFTLFGNEQEDKASTIRVVNSFNRGEMRFRPSKAADGAVGLKQYGRGDTRDGKPYSKAMGANNSVDVSVQAEEATKFLWLDGSCQRSYMELDIPQKKRRALEIDANVSIAIGSEEEDEILPLSALSVSTHNADIACTGLEVSCGGVKVRSSVGDIEATRLWVDSTASFTGDKVAEFVSDLGAVQIEDSSFRDTHVFASAGAGSLVMTKLTSSMINGRARVEGRSVSGSITANNLRANWVQLRSEAGAINGVGLSSLGSNALLGRLDVATISGDVNLRQVEGGGNIHVESSSGDIYIQVQSLSFVGLYQLRSEHGQVTMRLGQFGTDAITNSSSANDPRELTGTINCPPDRSCLAFGDLHVRSHTGDIHVVLGCDTLHCN